METSLPPGLYEVAGSVVKSYIEGFKLVRHVPFGILAKHGIATLKGGEYGYDASASFPLENMVDALRELEGTVGARKMFEVGLEIPKNVTLPPGAVDIKSAMQVLDAGYHMNHYCKGAPMFDPVRRAMTEGIGHYRCAATSPQRIVMDIDSPYPCDLDRGIMQGWAVRFQRSATVTHLDPQICRKNGARNCRYEITWK